MSKTQLKIHVKYLTHYENIRSLLHFATLLQHSQCRLSSRFNTYSTKYKTIY